MIGAQRRHARAGIFCCFVAVTLSVAGTCGAADNGDYRYKPELFEGLEYRNIGPQRGGRATAVAGVIGQPHTFYMGATGGGVWKSTNAGGSWSNISDKFFKTGSVGAIAVAPSDANVIYVGMGESPFRGVASSHGDGVYKSTDAGKTWTHVGLGDIRQTARIEIHPDNPDLVYVAAQGSPWAPTKDRGIYRSRDGGKTWRNIHFINDTTGAIDIRIDQTNPRILYAAMWDTQRKPWEIRSGGPGSGIFKSVDGGDNWERLDEGLPDLMGKIGVTPSPANPERVWAIVEAKEKGGLYRSDDGGKKWTLINQNRKLHARSWYYMHITADPRDENTVYVMNSDFFRSVDAGKTVEEIKAPHGDRHGLWINPDHPNFMILADDGGATVSVDGGKSWSPQNNQPTAQFYRVNVDNQIPYRVYGGQQDNSTVAVLSRGPDGSIGREDYHSVGGCESAHVAFDPDNPRFVYAGCYLGQISIYDSELGQSRQIRAYPATGFGIPPRERKYRFNWNAPIIVSAHDPNVVFHAGNVLLKSVDRGHSWTAVSPDLTRDEDDKQGPGGHPITNEVTENYNTIFALTESPHEAGVMWVGSDDGLVHITRDGGGSWTEVTPKGIGEAIINSIEVSPHDPATAYVVATRYKFNDHKPMIFRTTDYGARWRAIAKGIPDGAFVRVVREDSVAKGLLYAGTETGMFVSFDDGKAWQPLQMNLPAVPVTDIKVHGNDLVLSTQGRAFWILDDISPLRQLSDEIAKAELHLFAPAPATMIRRQGFGGGGGGKNPPNGAIIYYQLAGEPDLEEETLALEVLDGDGNVLRRLESDKEKGVEGGGRGSSYKLPAKAGLNRAVWDFRRAAITKIPGVFALGGGPDQIIDGTILPPGDYTLRLSLGDESRQQPISVAWDPRVAIDDAALAAHQDLLSATYARIEELHKSIISLRSVREQIDKQVELAKEAGDGEAIDEAGKAVVDKIEAWEKSIVSAEREFFQDVLNWPDRLDTELQELMGEIDGDDPPMTAGMKERFDDLEPKWLAAMAERDRIIAEELAAFNTLFRDQARPAITVPPTAAGSTP